MKSILLLLSIFSASFCFAGASDLQFIQNKHQWDAQALYKTDIPGGHVFFAKNFLRYAYFDVADLDAVHEARHEKDGLAAYKLKVDCYAYDVQFVGANANASIEPNNQYSNYYNYFIGNDQSKWAGNVAAFADITYQNMYNNIDVKAYSQGKAFKYDFIIHANANAADISIAYKGITPSITAEGQLALPIGFNTLHESKPYTYQIVNGVKKEIACKYIIKKNKEIGFELGDYDHSIDLIIDPILVFSTYSGSAATTYGFSATYDLLGSLYSGGECFAVGWPSTLGAYQVTYGGAVDCGINKYTPTGTGLIFSTYYGGGNADTPDNMVVSNGGELAVMGSTTSTNLATTTGCFDNTLGGNSDVFVVHFNTTGSALIGATYVGGSGTESQNAFNLSPNYGDSHRGEIFFDINDEMVVASSTTSTDFPVTTAALQATNGGLQDGCFFKVNSNCSSLMFATYLGGSGYDACFSVVKNSLNNWIIAGGTTSSNFPTVAGAYQTTYQGGNADAFVTEVNNLATGIVHSTFVGTSAYDHGFKVQTEQNDTIYLCGQTSGTSFPVSPGVYSNAGASVFIMKLTPTLSANVLSTRIGQSSNLIPTAFLKDNCGNVYFTGFQAQSGLPITTNAYQSATGGFWLSVLTGDFTSLVYATYMGANGDHCDGGTSRFDPQGIVYHSVCTSSPSQYNVTTYAPAKNSSASWDIASFKFDFQLAASNATLSILPNDSGCVPFPVNFSSLTSIGQSFLWNFGDGTTSTLANPTHIYLTPGVFNVTLIAFNPNSSCDPSDTAYTTIRVVDSIDAAFTKNVILNCIDDTAHFTMVTQNQPASTLILWNFGDGFYSTNVNPTHIYYTQGIYTVTCTVTNQFCTEIATAIVNVQHPIDAQFFTSLNNVPKDSICLGVAIKATASASVPQGNLSYTYNWGDGTNTTTSVNNTTHNYTTSGNYSILLTVTDNIGCKDSIRKPVFVDEPPYLDFVTSSGQICVGQPLVINDTLVATTKNFKWDFGDNATLWNVHDPMHTYETANTFYVTLTGYYPVCDSISKTIPVTVSPYPIINLGPDQSICEGIIGSVQLKNLSNVGSINSLWSNGSTNNVITASEPGVYWLQESIGSCTTTDSVTIKRDCYLDIPNSFTPNADGLNDYFIPTELLTSGVTTLNINIFSRWGELIFNTTNINSRGWDGKFGEKPQPMGAYVYQIDVTFKNKERKTYTGNVTLLR
jgi:gliding motility-associated-like protein